MGSHLNKDGQFQSDKYPTTPAGKVPFSVTDRSAQDFLWEYANRHRAADAEFADDLQTALRAAGFDRDRQHLAAAMGAVVAHADRLVHIEMVDYLGRMSEALAQGGALAEEAETIGSEFTPEQREDYADHMLHLAALALAQLTLTAIEMPDAGELDLGKGWRSKPSVQEWRTIDEADKYADTYILFDPAIIDLDFNPTGTADGHWQDGEGWVGAVWCGSHDEWHQKVLQPTHFMPKPSPPLGFKSAMGEGALPVDMPEDRPDAKL